MIMEIREAADVAPSVIRLINRSGLPLNRLALAVGVDAATVRRWAHRQTAPSVAAWADLLDAAQARMWLCWTGGHVGPVTTAEGLIDAVAGLIRSLGITQTAADQAAGLSQGTISRWRHGKMAVKLPLVVEALKSQGAWLRVEVSEA